MKAITYAEYGPPEVLKVEDVAKPQPGDDDVLVRVHAVEATKADCELRSFKFPVQWFWLPLRLVLGVRRPKQRILGVYFAGEVASIGRNVDQFSVGDPVFGVASLELGAYAEYLKLSQDATMVEKPTNMTFAEAAAVPLGGLNALHFLTRAKLQPGESVLVNGAGGSIGGHAVQIAKAMGAEVTAVDGGHKRERLLALGADHFVDYTKQDFSATGKRYDVVFNMVASASYSSCMRVLKPNGRFLTGNPRLSVMLRAGMTNAFTRRRATFAFAKETKEELRALKHMIEQGKIRPFVDQVFPMEQAAKAHRKVETEQRLGTIVIAISTDHARK